MNSGDLRHLVTLDDPAGGPLDPPTWWCGALEDTSGTTTLLGRYHPGISTATRLTFKGRVYHVEAIRNREGRDVTLELICREVFD